VNLNAALLILTMTALAACAGRQQPAPVDDRTGRAAARPPAMKAEAKASPEPAAAADGYYVVKKGDTLYSIALDNGADYREVAQWNTLDDPTKLRIGQVLRVVPPAEAAAVTVTAARGVAAPETKPIGASSAPSAAAPPAAAPSAKAQPEALGQFIWPAKGKVLAGFSEPRSKGIDIDGKPGDPVVAAAAGRVTYIGSGIPGLGKLVVIRHDSGFITVYAHNRNILVKEQQAVSRGERIAELGSTDADRPKLHFQIRKGSAPVDPLRYLPAS
jgi:lipoprotein NlpD